MPLRATSIIPLEKVTPTRIPELATIMITVREATLDPIEEFKKLTASLLTPTIRSKTAKQQSRIIATRNMSISTLPGIVDKLH